MKKWILPILLIVLSEYGRAGQCDPLYFFKGFDYWEYFGASIDIGGDANGDGYDDILIGAGYLDFGLQEDNGAAFVFSGLTGDTLFVFRGAIPRVYFGLDVAWAGDVNNDGYDDILVGSPGGAPAWTGQAFVFSGLDGDTLHIFSGESTYSEFGRSVSTAGDVNNDGYDGFIVGASSFDNFRGRVYVFSGNTGDTVFALSGNSPEQRFGHNVASAGDLNNDGFGDIMISTYPFQDPCIGQAFVISGSSGDTLYIFSGNSCHTEFGQRMTSAGDVNDDGIGDLIIGEAGFSGTANRIGRAYVFSGADGDTIRVHTGEYAFNLLGSSVSGTGDIDQDGFDDYLVVAKDYNSGDLYAVGRVYVFSGKTGDTLQLLTGNGYYMGLGGVATSLGDVDADGYSDMAFHSVFLDSSGEYLSRVTVHPVVSCRGIRGDANGDQYDADILDLTSLVNRIFKGSHNPSCFHETDVNSDGSHGNILDLTFLVDFLFRGGPAPGAC